MAESTFRARVCFQKSGPLRHLSHLETVHACGRAARRARLPYAVTKGFSPHMRIAFGPALPVGTAGLGEYYDLWLRSYIPANDVLASLTSATPANLAPVNVVYVGERSASLTAALTIARYEVLVEGGEGLSESLAGSLAAIVAEGVFAVEHKGKQKVFELASTLPKEPEVSSVNGATVVRLTTRMGERGSLRPETLVTTALAREKLEGRIASVTRTELLVEEEDSWRSPM
jgi:radical SAM-linked protein